MISFFWSFPAVGWHSPWNRDWYFLHSKLFGCQCSVGGVHLFDGASSIQKACGCKSLSILASHKHPKRTWHVQQFWALYCCTSCSTVPASSSCGNESKSLVLIKVSTFKSDCSDVSHYVLIYWKEIMFTTEKNLCSTSNFLYMDIKIIFPKCGPCVIQSRHVCC